MVRFEHVTKIFQDTDTIALQDMNLYVPPGQLCFLKGRSGIGKTTLLKLLLVELKADAGNVYVNGRNLAQLERREIPYYRRNIGFIFQDYKLVEDMSVFRNVALTRYIAGVSGKTVTLEVAHALRMVGLEDCFKRYPKELSGGERQRVAIARALVGNPLLILADEPTSNLDPNNSRMIMELLDGIHKQLGITMLIATQDDAAIRGLEGRIFDMCVADVTELESSRQQL